MSEHRKAFIDPYWAICIGLVLATSLILVLASAGVVPTATYAL